MERMKRIDINFMLPAIVLFVVAVIRADIVNKVLIILGTFFFVFASFPMARQLATDIQKEIGTKKNAQIQKSN